MFNYIFILSTASPPQSPSSVLLSLATGFLSTLSSAATLPALSCPYLSPGQRCSDKDSCSAPGATCVIPIKVRSWHLYLPVAPKQNHINGTAILLAPAPAVHHIKALPGIDDFMSSQPERCDCLVRKVIVNGNERCQGDADTR